MLRQLDAFALSRGWPVAARHWDKVTGDPGRRKGDPPGLRLALVSMEKLRGRGVLVVTGVERLVRSPIALVQMIARVQAIPGAVCSMEDGADCDTTSDVGELTLFIRGWFSRMYLTFVRRQTCGVLNDRKALIRSAGGFVSSRSKVWRTRLGRPSLPEDKQAVIRELIGSGLSAYRIARLHGLKESTVRTYLRRFGERVNR